MALEYQGDEGCSSGKDFAGSKGIRVGVLAVPSRWGIAIKEAEVNAAPSKAARAQRQRGTQHSGFEAGAVT